MIKLSPGVQLSQGPQVDKFEAELAQTLNVPVWAVVAVSTGTAALHLALLVGHEADLDSSLMITVPATTFIATANVIRYCGMVLRIADVRPDTWTLYDYEETEDAITVDLYGVPATNQKHLPNIEQTIIEDACESLGTTNVPYSKLACFSFFASKIITTGGEGGAVVALDKTQADHIRLLRQQGKNFTMQKHAMLGYNYRMTEYQARYGLRELKCLSTRVHRTREINRLYREALPSFRFQEDPSHGSNCWQTALVLENRDQVQAELKKAKIESKKVFCSLADYPWLLSHRNDGGDDRPETPVADWLAEHGLCLPSHWSLTDEQVGRVASVIGKFGRTCEYG